MKKLAILLLVVSFFSCNNSTKNNKTATTMDPFEKGSYGYDLQLLKEHLNPIELKNGNARIILSPEYQGRVMTSSSKGEEGMSYGWINHELIASGKKLKQINPVGGEERFWLGPEGGQFSIFFGNNSSFDFENWETPACIDTEAFNLKFINTTEAVFTKNVELKNYSNFEFLFEIERKVSLLTNDAIRSHLNIVFQDGVHCVGYMTENQLKNTGDSDWKKESGLLSIWMLGMFNPSPEVTVVIPYKTDAESEYIVKDNYFGKVPSDRLVLKNGFVFFKGDGKQRGKIGIPPQRAMPVIGSYDANNQLLTIVKCDIPEGVNDYVNSAWEMQEFPFKGDAINSYNDGPQEDGSQLGPFYELETSSPALALKREESATYTQSTIHFQGTEEEINAICQQIFNITLMEIKAIF